MSEWIDINERLPEVSFTHVLVTKHYHNTPELKHVTRSFFIKDRIHARENKGSYSRKLQGKNSVHFDESDCGFVITHWMPMPEPAI
ncbi:MAG: DUF551 domain-containing protein [bacterium]|nr:DUF551 domain-containing protein [bacterium]